MKNMKIIDVAEMRGSVCRSYVRDLRNVELFHNDKLITKTKVLAATNDPNVDKIRFIYYAANVCSVEFIKKERFV